MFRYYLILFHPLQILAQAPTLKKFMPIPLQCRLNSLQPTIFDQDIYIKKIEDLSQFPHIASKTTFEVVTCAKNLSGDVLGCVKKIPHQYTPVNECQQSFIGFPMQMNT